MLDSALRTRGRGMTLGYLPLTLAREAPSHIGTIVGGRRMEDIRLWASGAATGGVDASRLEAPGGDM
jgi:hypothetical protein